MALTTLHLAAVPLLAGLAAGTGAIATFVSTSAAPVPTATAAVVVQPSTRPCETQTWPYIDRACLASGQAAQHNRPVRVVAAPRVNETPDAASTAVPAPAVTPPTAAPDGGAPLVSSDTVLRQPQNLTTDTAAPAPQVKKPKNSRRETQRKRERQNAQSYQVPAELRDDRATRPVIVVHPLRWGD